MRRPPSRTILSHFLRQPPLIRSKDGHRRSQFFLGMDPVPSSEAAASVRSPLTEAVISGPSAGIVPRSTGEAPPWAQPAPGPLRQKVGKQSFRDVDFNGNDVILGTSRRFGGPKK
jgi:hypothetical protein